MEEQGSAGGAERQIAKLVEDNEIGVGEAGGDLSWFAQKLLLFKSVDEKNRTRLRRCSMAWTPIAVEMRLARAGATEQDDVVGVFQELAAMKNEIDSAAADRRRLHRIRYSGLSIVNMKTNQLSILRLMCGVGGVYDCY
jgi:hypothetical protein